jgi:hypothetical protein
MSEWKRATSPDADAYCCRCYADIRVGDPCWRRSYGNYPAFRCLGCHDEAPPREGPGPQATAAAPEALVRVVDGADGNEPAQGPASATHRPLSRRYL